ncbi:helix-turn-helix transcriptional regulator [Streptomyces nanshensis]|uniref:HTH luxR-type domain-containing protein n=1 Tax=Streptomyces nanshensis TaxID=518642 RepID=A0A1E7L9Y3_9ACTN|nr:hypothetical protein [Streptomyces nanshensis]OEV13006.1 hypothetical protein AN218_05720 [Streptomyces nanshensis]
MSTSTDRTATRTDALRKAIEQAARQTPRNPFEVIHLLAGGKRGPEIARTFGVGPDAIKDDTRLLRIKTRSRNNAELVGVCCVQGIVPLIPHPTGITKRILLRHSEILELKALGYTYEQTANTLRISLNTVQAHAKQFMFDFSARTAPHAVALYRQRINSVQGHINVSCENCQSSQCFSVFDVRQKLGEQKWKSDQYGQSFWCPNCPRVNSSIRAAHNARRAQTPQ